MKKQLCTLLCLSGLLTLSGCNWFEKKEVKTTSETVETQAEGDQDQTSNDMPATDMPSEEVTPTDDDAK